MVRVREWKYKNSQHKKQHLFFFIFLRRLIQRDSALSYLTSNPLTKVKIYRHYLEVMAFHENLVCTIKKGTQNKS